MKRLSFGLLSIVLCLVALGPANATHEGRRGGLELEPRNIEISADGTKVLSGGVGFMRNTTSGELSYQGHIGYLPGEEHRPTSVVALSEDGNHFYGLMGSGVTIAQYSFADPGQGAMSPDGKFGRDVKWVRDWSNNADGISGLTRASALRVVGDHLYVSAGSTLDPSVGWTLVFGIAADGSLTYLQKSTLEPFGNGLLATPDGASLYGGLDNSLAKASRDPATGLLGEPQTVPGALTGLPAAFSPDGMFLYAQSNEGIAIFAVTSTGVTLVDTETNEGPAPRRYSALAISPDGSQVFVTGFPYPDSLVVYDRDAASGSLAKREMFEDGVNGVDGLESPNTSVAVSPDGRSVYVGSSGEQTIAVFDRTAGELSYLQAYPKEEENFVHPRAVSLSFQGDILKGRVTVLDGETDCQGVGFLVKIEKRKSDGTWANTGVSARGRNDGTYRQSALATVLRKGTFRAFIGVQDEGPLGTECGSAYSATVKRSLS